MSRMLIAAATCALFCLAACENDKVPEPRPAPSAAAAPAPSAAAPAPAAAAVPAATGSTADNIPVAADFEDEAEKTITKANYKAELSLLEAELK